MKNKDPHFGLKREQQTNCCGHTELFYLNKKGQKHGSEKCFYNKKEKKLCWQTENKNNQLNGLYKDYYNLENKLQFLITQKEDEEFGMWFRFE